MRQILPLVRPILLWFSLTLIVSLNLPQSYECCQSNETVIDGACHPCFGEWKVEKINKPMEFKSLKEWPNAQFDFLTCTDCDAGTRVLTRTRWSVQCPGGDIVNVTGCSYACPGQNHLVTAVSANVALQMEFQKGTPFPLRPDNLAPPSSLPDRQILA